MCVRAGEWNVPFVEGNDTEPNFLPFSDIAAIDVRFSRVSDGAVSPAPLFDFTPLAGLNGRSGNLVLTNMTNLTTGMYLLTARALDKAGLLFLCVGIFVSVDLWI